MLEARDGFAQAFAFGRNGKPRAIELPPRCRSELPIATSSPYACCRHIQPAVEALIDLMKENKLSAGDIRDVKVDTYSIAAEHAHTGWQDYASAQLSFPYIMAIGMRHGWIKVEHFEDKERGDPKSRGSAAWSTSKALPRWTGCIRRTGRARHHHHRSREIREAGDGSFGRARSAARRCAVRRQIPRSGRSGVG
ncbi:MAG: hypothetical protein WDN48_15875 [Pseudolabrys sp.]